MSMLAQIKKSIEREVSAFADELKKPPLSAIPGHFNGAIEQFIRRKGKRLRSVLFVVGYKGYSTRRARHLYRSAASLELLHDFILIHDDLIDRASLRRGSASMHAHLDQILKAKKGNRFKGTDLALIVGDMMFAMAINAFMSVSENPARKQRALDLLTRTALFTGCGELDELMQSLRPLGDVKAEDIYRIYDWKTGHYTFSSPLTMGATLGGATRRDIAILTDIGTHLGRAFQIKDDLIDFCGNGNRYGKPALIDLREGKKTLPVWYAYRKTRGADRALIRTVLEKPGASAGDIQRVADIILAAGAMEFAVGEINRLLEHAVADVGKTRMKARYRDFLIDYSRELLTAPQPHA